MRRLAPERGDEEPVGTVATTVARPGDAGVDTVARAAAVVAVVGGGTSLLAFLLIHMLRPEVDPATDRIAFYAVGDQSWLLAAALLLQALAAAALAVALHRGLPDGARTPVGVTILALYAAAVVGVAISPPATDGGAAVPLIAATVALPLAAILIIGAAMRDAAWHGRWFLGLLTIGLVATATLELTSATSPGVTERAFVALGAIWVIAAAAQHRAAIDRRASSD